MIDIDHLSEDELFSLKESIDNKVYRIKKRDENLKDIAMVANKTLQSEVITYNANVKLVATICFDEKLKPNIFIKINDNDIEYNTVKYCLEYISKDFYDKYTEAFHRKKKGSSMVIDKISMLDVVDLDFALLINKLNQFRKVE